MNLSFGNSSSKKRYVFLSYLIITAGLVTSAKKVGALEFNLIPNTDVGIDADALAGFQAAADIWSNALSDDITINLQIGFENLGSPNTIAQAGSNRAVFSYSGVGNNLIADASSSDDALATSNLPNIAGNSSRFAFVGTEENNSLETLDGYNIATNSFDVSADNFALAVNRANAKALGLIGGNDTTVDASISFNSNFSFDLDRSDGINAGEIDFVGVAVHEIGHALGFSSGVDSVDVTVSADPNVAGTDIDDFAVFNVLDLYRHSDLSVAVSEDVGFGVLDLSVSGKDSIDPTTNEIMIEEIFYEGEFFDAEPYISIDGGLTPLNTNGVEGFLSTGVNLGDGQQASHWQDNSGIGLLDPTVAFGELLVLSDSDLRALDIVGFDLASSTSVPFEFSPGFGLFIVGSFFTWRKFKKS